MVGLPRMGGSGRVQGSPGFAAELFCLPTKKRVFPSGFRHLIRTVLGLLFVQVGL